MAEIFKKPLDAELANKADKTDTVLDTTLSRGRTANTTVGTGSFAFGDDVTANGIYSHAEGQNTKATGAYMHVFGKGNVEENLQEYDGWAGQTQYKKDNKVVVYRLVDGEYVQYKYICIEDHTSGDDGFDADIEHWVEIEDITKHIEVVGNNLISDVNGSNARALDWDGNEYLAGNVYVECNDDSSGGVPVSKALYIRSSNWASIWEKINTLSPGESAPVFFGSSSYGTFSGGARSSGSPYGVITRTSDSEFRCVLAAGTTEMFLCKITNASSSSAGTYTEKGIAAIMEHNAFTGDIDTLKIPGRYYVSNASSTVGGFASGLYGLILVLGNTLTSGTNSGRASQLFMATSSNTMWYRRLDSSGWGPIQHVALHDHVYYGLSGTAASTQMKEVTISNFPKTLTVGLMVRIWFSKAQSYDGVPSLKVNDFVGPDSTTANPTGYPIYLNANGGSAAIPAGKYAWQANTIHDFVFDGARWVLVNEMLATASYPGNVKLSNNYTSSAGAAADGMAASSKAVYDAYTALDTKTNITDGTVTLNTESGVSGEAYCHRIGNLGFVTGYVKVNNSGGALSLASLPWNVAEHTRACCTGFASNGNVNVSGAIYISSGTKVMKFYYPAEGANVSMFFNFTFKIA